jgi:hypothetical protein
MAPRDIPPTPASVANAPNDRGARFGASAIHSQPNPRWYHGTVVKYWPKTQTYWLSTPHGQKRKVPRLSGHPGDLTALPIGTQVVCHEELGYCVIDSVLKMAASQSVDINPSRITEVQGIGGEDSIYDEDDEAINHRAPNDPNDILQGDHVTKSPDHNMIGVLAGGVNVIKSSPLAQVRTNSLDDSVEIISNLYRHISAIGDLSIKNEGGKTSLQWRAGSDQTTETGANASNWTVRLDVGGTPEADLFSLEITTPQGGTLARIHMSAEGRLSLTGVAGVDTTSGANGTDVHDVVADAVENIGGNRTTSVVGDSIDAVGGGRSASVSENDSLVVGGTASESFGANRFTYVAGQDQKKVQGGSIPTPGLVAAFQDLLNGGMETVFANPLLGAQAILPYGNWINYGGGFNFVLQPTATGPFSVVSTLPNSVQLGANGAAVYVPGVGHTIVPIATFGAMLWEPWLTLMTAMLALIDSHTHLTAIGPTSPMAAGAPGPISPIIGPLLPTVRSLRVAIGA